MAWRIVKQPNGQYARFADPVDDFTHYNMTREEAIQVCVEEFMPDILRKVERSDNEPNRFQDCLETIELLKGKKVREEREREMQ